MRKLTYPRRSFVLIVLTLFLFIPAVTLTADELDDALQNNVYGAGPNINIGFGVSAEYSILHLEGEIPLGPILRLSPQLAGMFGAEGDILLGGGIQCYLGAPPSKEKFRLFGGPLVRLTGFTDMLFLYTGGSGGAEIFMNDMISFRIEAGGGYQFDLLNLDGYTLFCLGGKFSFYFPS